MRGRTLVARLTVPVAIALAMAAPTGARTAAAQVPTLERVDSLVQAGSYEWARATLKQWWSARDRFDVPGSDRARALMLRGRLARDIATAEPDYLALVLGYPTSPHAPEALLRLGQGLLAADEPTRAAGYLQRLVTEYPGVEQRGRALLWLARASRGAGRADQACSAARQGLEDDAAAELSELLRIEEAAACGVVSGPVASGDPPRQPGQESGPVREPGPVAPAGEFAVQAGAFRYQEGARDLMARLREAGHEPRAVVVPRNDLLRIRVGRFTSVNEAAQLVTKLKAQGFDAVVVRDADRERAP